MSASAVATIAEDYYPSPHPIISALHPPFFLTVQPSCTQPPVFMSITQIKENITRVLKTLPTDELKEQVQRVETTQTAENNLLAVALKEELFKRSTK